MAPQERNSLPCEETSAPQPSCNGAQSLPQETSTAITPDQNRILERLSSIEAPQTPTILVSKAEDAFPAFINKAFSADEAKLNTNYRDSLTPGLNKLNSLNLSDPNRRNSRGDVTSVLESAEEELTDFDDLLPHLGEFGFYQKILFLMMIPFAFYVAFVYFAQIFITLVPEQHWCMVPELMNLTQSQRISLAIPSEDGLPSHCQEYAVDWKALVEAGPLPPQADNSWTTRPCSRGWEFNLTDVPYHTISSEFGWVCDKDNRPATAQAIFFCGAILGGLVFGWLADKYGRIPSLVGTNLIGFLAGVATALCSNFWQFCICRFLVGMAFDNCFTMMYILVLEYVGPKWRTFVANMSIALFFTLASCLLPWIAWFLADWRWFAVVTSAPLVLALATPWLVPESVRWLVSQGKIEKALVILKNFEKVNNAKIPDKVLHDFTESCLKIQKEEETSGRSYSVLELFKTPRLRKTTILLIIIWMIISLVFDGHVRNVGSLGLDIFLTFTVAAATELPADTFLTAVLDKWGRRWLACGSMVFSGIFSLLATTVPMGGYSAGLAIMGRFAVNIAYNIGLQYAAELLPTVVRAQGVAFIHIMGYVASILAPFIVYLVTYYQALPLLILGVLGVVGGLLCLFLPETAHKLLPQNLQDGEAFGKDQTFWEFPCCGKHTDEEEEVHHDHPGFYLRRSSLACSSMRSAASRRSSVGPGAFLRPAATLGGPLNRASVRASVRTHQSLRRRTVSMSSNGMEKNPA